VAKTKNMINGATELKKLKIKNRTSVTVKSIANYCLVSESTVRRWIKDDKLSALRLPSGQYRITAADFMIFLKRFGITTKEL
jgi:excisionase family DNA binding protein